MECIGQGSARTNWQIYFNSPPLQSVFCEYYVHYNWAQLSTRTHYGVYPASSNYTLWQWKLSTRTLYGVYLFVILNILASRSFQLALTTECIKRRNAQRKTIYFFNSHPLRSVSSLVAMFLPLVAFQLALTYGAYPNPKSALSILLAFQLAPSTECILLAFVW